ncbi:MAG: deoxyribonuclease IV [Methanomicrobiales archaeon]|nr:deoxyribonuclease IV [Methanomicrobiales archaeon]NYT20792.1 deoxyribonuclease IV [Methanomicrobiales archaeon]
MIRVGVHVSIAGSIAKSVERAETAGCDTFQIFSRNPRGWAFRDLDPGEAALFRENVERSGLFPAVDHMPYLPNLATGKAEFYEKSITTLTAELGRCGTLAIPFLVTHLGHHLGEGIEIGRKRVISAVNQALAGVDNDVILLLENTAGEKNGVGSTFEDIAAVIEGIEARERVGVCFDTCHAFGAGYELRTREGIDQTVNRFTEILGEESCMLIHLNDSKGGLGSGLDRHEHIGLGNIGEEGFRLILSHPFFRSRPLICETPVDDRRDDAENIRVVRNLAGK